MAKPQTRRIALFCAATLILGFAPLAAQAQPSKQLSSRAAAQIEALAAAKAARTPAENKVDGALLTAAQLSAGRQLPAGVRARSTVKVDSAGRTTVNIRASVNSALVRKVTALGGRVQRSSAHDGVIRAEIPLSAVAPLSKLSAVTRLQSLSADAITSRIGAPAPLSKQQRQDSIRQQLAKALDRSATTERTLKASISTGSVVSEGDRAHGADVARAQRKVSGVGITVGVLSDGVDSLPTSIATQNLPADVQVLPGQAGDGDEGTAMLEIVHDLAPKAHLAFATAFNGEASFADNIRALRAAGADIIVDDVIYFDESPFQDGPIAQAVLDVTHDGALYFSSAGNEGNVDDGTAGNYEGDFRSSGQALGKVVGVAHDFDPGSGVQIVDTLSAGSYGAPVILWWADALGHASDDYDVYAIDSEDTVVGFSNSVQNGDDDPFEIFQNTGEGNVRLVVVKYAGADRYFQLSALRGRFVADGDNAAYATPGVTRGHSTVPAAYNVAAVPAAGAFRPLEEGDEPGPSGPYPGRYSSTQQTEKFTSDGPRRVFTPAGEPITPGNFSSSGGHVRAKPSLSAADGVSTSVAGFETFYGTSASAPHAAAMAALALSGRPGLTPHRLRRAFNRTAIDIERSGYDRDTGAGIINATALMAAVHAHGQPYAEAGEPVVRTSTDGDAYLESGEQATVVVPVTNRGDVTATHVRVRLTSTTAGVRIAPARRDYGNIGVGQRQQHTFLVTVPRTATAGSRVALSVRVAFRGGFSPRLAERTILVGEPSSQVVTSSYTGDPVAIPDGSTEGASVSLPVENVGPVSKVTFSIDGSSCNTDEGSTTVGIDHTFVSDLVGTLTSPDGTQTQLFDGVGGSSHNLCQTVLEDSASRSIQEAISDDAPFTGDWRPTQPLADLIGTQGNGTWTFRVEDQAGVDTGSIRAVSVHLNGFVS